MDPVESVVWGPVDPVLGLGGLLGGQEGRDWDEDEQDGGASINSRRGTADGR